MNSRVDELEREIHFLHQARTDLLRVFEAMEGALDLIRATFAAKREQNRRQSNADVAREWEILSKMGPQLANLDMAYGGLSEQLDQLLQKSLNILASVQNVDEHQDVETKIQEIEKKVRDEEIEFQRFKGKMENIHKQIACFQEEICQEMDKLQIQIDELHVEMVKEEHAPAEYQGNSNDD